MKTLWQHCHVASMAHGAYSIIEDAAIVTCAGRIEWIGPRQALADPVPDSTVDLGGAWVTPGLIDCHTHAVFGGDCQCLLDAAGGGRGRGGHLRPVGCRG